MNTAVPTTSSTTRLSRLLIALAAAAWLAACGGGGAGDAPSESTPDVSHAGATGNADEAGAIDSPAPIPTPDVDAGDRSLTLAWQAPLTNEDGSPLTDLAGYRIYYGSRSGHYGASVAVNDPAALHHRIESLAPGTYYVVVKAVNSAGAQSIASPEASKTIQ